MPETRLDIERPAQLLAYLRRTGRIGPRERPAFRTLRGGVSNRTVLVERPSGEAWVVKQALEKLRVEADWTSSPLRIHREAEGMRWLERLAPPGAIPALCFEDREEHLLAMAAVPAPHENWKTMLLAGRLDEKHVEAFARLLAAIHRRAFERRREVAPLFDDRSFFESLRLEPYYQYAAEKEPQARAFLHALIASTRARRFTLVHGDFSPKNILVRAGRLVLLDHEVIHFGDGAFDLGFSLTHLLSKAHHLRPRREAFAAAAGRYWNVYREALGKPGARGAPPFAEELEMHAVRHTIGCLLARVAGRSPLEYLDAGEREAQRRAALRLLAAPPGSVALLIPRFLEGLQ